MGSRSQVLRTRLRVARATGQYCPSTVLALRLADVLAVPFTALFWLEGAPDGSNIGT
jgi:DNA-binding XRE family transcriptional regulator